MSEQEHFIIFLDEAGRIFAYLGATAFLLSFVCIFGGYCARYFQ